MFVLLGAVFTHRAHKRKASEHVVVAWAVLARWASAEAMLAAGCGLTRRAGPSALAGGRTTRHEYWYDLT